MTAQSTATTTTFATIAIIRNSSAGTALALLLLLFILGAATDAQAQQQRARKQRVQPRQNIDAAMLDTLKAMQKELQDIKTLLAARPQNAAPTQAAPSAAVAPRAVALDLTNRPFRGSPDAPVTIVEFTDYECPFCSRHAVQTLPLIEKEYIATGKVKYYVVDLPLEQIHPNALKAAVAVRCANEQGKYWEMHDRLFAAQRGTLTNWSEHAQAIGIDAAQFAACVGSDKYVADVRKDIALTQQVGVSGTPGFFFATGAGAKVTTTSFMNGARPFPQMKEQIDALLLAQQQKQPQQQKQTAKASGQ